MKGVFMSRHSLRLQFTIWAVLTVGAGWAFMFAIGVVHHEWITSCPTIGFWWAILLSSCCVSPPPQVPGCRPPSCA
jgi:hypothetical protein